ncbi:putative calcium-binding protein CML9 [Panicum miliaceum]|uniref:Calcium-binding protein CML9 n=1 Tax=Panicum miliaceum TaxID=4540 RepID=A0A3L6R7R1_PANMI|nr:putative calcium-binding protein CML9 [Panicum miliaceum]
MAEKLTPEQADECKEIFDLFDADEDGKDTTAPITPAPRTKTDLFSVSFPTAPCRSHRRGRARDGAALAGPERGRGRGAALPGGRGRPRGLRRHRPRGVPGRGGAQDGRQAVGGAPRGVLRPVRRRPQRVHPRGAAAAGDGEPRRPAHGGGGRRDAPRGRPPRRGPRRVQGVRQGAAQGQEMTRWSVAGGRRRP